MITPGRTTIVTTKRELAAALCLCAILVLTSTVQQPDSAQSRGDNKDGQVWAAVAP
jgi:hypothetical protein